jgi:hypothetical protein
MRTNRTHGRSAFVAAGLALASSSASAHDFSGFWKLGLGVVFVQAIPLLWVIRWHAPRFVGWYVFALIVSWPLAIAGAMQFESSWPLLLLLVPWAAFPVLAGVRRRRGENVA